MMDDKKRARILVLGSKMQRPWSVEACLEKQFQVDTFNNMHDAMSALRTQMYDAIFADIGDFLPLERALVNQQANLVLDTIGEGVMMVDDDGRCRWSNKKMRSFPVEVINKVKQICLQARTLFLKQPDSSSLASSMASNGQFNPVGKSRKFTIQAKGRYFELVASPIIDETNKIRQVVAVVWDATYGKLMEQKINTIDAAGRELAKLESDKIAKLQPSERLGLLRDKIISYSKDLMEFDHFAIRVVDQRTNKLEMVIAEGLPSEAIEVDLYVQPEGNGISGYVAATGRSYICHDTEKDPRFVLGMEHCKSSLTVPLRLHDSIIGVFNIESQEVGAFSEDDRQFAEIFGQYVAMALNILNLMVVERCNTSGRVADSVIQELTSPLNDIVTEAQSLQEAYIGDDSMRERLGKIINDVTAIRDIVRDVATGTKAVLGRDTQVNAEPLLHGKKILIADDEANIRQTIGDILTKYGCQCILCKDGYEAVHVLEEKTFDLVITDIKMPHRNGYEIFAAVQRLEVEIPVILMTGFGYDPHHSIVRASQEGLSAVMFKPFKVDQLLEQVHKALGIATTLHRTDKK